MAYDLSSLAHLKRREETIRSELRARMRHLRDDLDNALRRWAESDLEPSGLGIIQARGSEIDRLCGILYELREQREVMEAEAAQQDKGSEAK